MISHATAAIREPVAAARALDPVAAALAIAETSRRKADRSDWAQSVAAVVAITAGVSLALCGMAAILTSTATIPLWCILHAACA